MSDVGWIVAIMCMVGGSYVIEWHIDKHHYGAAAGWFSCIVFAFLLLILAAIERGGGN